MVVDRFSTGRFRALFWLMPESELVEWEYIYLNCSIESRSEYTIDCDCERIAYDVGMSGIRGDRVVVFCVLAACGGGKEANEPKVDQTAQADASAGVSAADAQSSNANVANVQTDAAALQAPEAGVQDDVDKSVSVCGDEAIPIEKRVRKKVKECWSVAASRNPALDGHVRVNFVVDSHGKVTKTEIVQAKTLGAETTTCITGAINAYKLDGTKCTGKTVSFEMAFGRAAHD
jgi:hypothetical protein